MQPGELAPKLALAATAELAGNVRRAAVLRDGVEHRQRRDLGRFRAGAGAVGRGRPGRRGAHLGRGAGHVAALHHRAADQRGDAAVGAVDERADRGADPRRGAPRRGAARSEPRVLQIRALVLGTALDWIGENKASTNHILGFPFTPHGLRLGVEASLRGLARVAPTRGAPVRAGRHGQRGTADVDVLARRSASMFGSGAAPSAVEVVVDP